jgi:aminoglycoside phosphotransferase family enzyme/predicted kinase
MDGTGARVLTAPPSAERITHASRVFLIGNDVWKLKRPVDFGFLDFRTLEARRHFCEEEVRLNRRLAPGIYHGVVPVRASPGGPALGGDGPIVDWAVHMRRLPSSASAAAMLAGGRLSPDRLAELAEKLAAFLREAPETPELGSPETLRENLDENFAQVEPFVGDVLERATFDDVRGFQDAALAAGRDRFAARVAGRKIREGHGDLRLEHVYFLPPPDGVVAIDCIEFNRRFRCGDVAGEAAFFAMELEAARRPDLAAAFLARFAEASDDFQLYGVLDFYLSYRAWVRGKVAAFLAADTAVGADVRARKRAEARRQFALARSFSGAPLDTPFVVAVTGVVGSGKSTLAAGLGRELAAPIISSDRTRKAIAGLAPSARGDASLYTPAALERNYREVFARAADVVSSGRGVILDATFSSRRWRHEAAALARRLGACFALIDVRCTDRDLLSARLAERRRHATVSDAGEADLHRLLAAYEPLDASDPGPRVVVDGGARPADAVATALHGLERVGVTLARRRRAS